MKAVGTLIKLYQRELDARRRSLNEVLKEQDTFRQKQRNAEEALVTEQQRAQEDTTLLFTLPAFVEGTRKRIEQYATQIGLLEVRVLELRNEINHIFGELKRYEIYEEMKTNEADQKRALIEQRAMDELGLRGHVYKDSDKA